LGSTTGSSSSSGPTANHDVVGHLNSFWTNLTIFGLNNTNSAIVIGSATAVVLILIIVAICCCCGCCGSSENQVYDTRIVDEPGTGTDKEMVAAAETNAENADIEMEKYDAEEPKTEMKLESYVGDYDTNANIKPAAVAKVARQSE
jgi:hypothetical protein